MVENARKYNKLSPQKKQSRETPKTGMDEENNFLEFRNNKRANERHKRGEEDSALWTGESTVRNFSDFLFASVCIAKKRVENSIHEYLRLFAFLAARTNDRDGKECNKASQKDKNSNKKFRQSSQHSSESFEYFEYISELLKLANNIIQGEKSTWNVFLRLLDI